MDKNWKKTWRLSFYGLISFPDCYGAELRAWNLTKPYAQLANTTHTQLRSHPCIYPFILTLLTLRLQKSKDQKHATGGPSLYRASISRFLHYVEFFSKNVFGNLISLACYFGFTISSFRYIELIGLQKWNRDSEGRPVHGLANELVMVLFAK